MNVIRALFGEKFRYMKRIHVAKSEVFYEWYDPGICPVKQLLSHKGETLSFHM